MSIQSIFWDILVDALSIVHVAVQFMFFFAHPAGHGPLPFNKERIEGDFFPTRAGKRDIYDMHH
jgi:hypothetical protein